MSNHHFETTYQGEPVLVDLGWDRPLQHHFLVVMKLTPAVNESVAVEADELDDDHFDEEEDVVYSNLNEANAFGLPLEYFRAKLGELAITVPESMFVQAELDRFNNTGNRMVRHSIDGTFQENSAVR